MAIWQYNLYFLPEEEINFYFANEHIMTEDALNEIDWWAHKQLDSSSFNVVESYLRSKRSWSKNIVLFGHLDSNCFEILLESGRMIEVTARIDLRVDYSSMVKVICQFGRDNNLALLNYKFEILPPEVLLLEKDIMGYKSFDDFLKKVT